MISKKSIIKTVTLLIGLGFLLGCETGTHNKVTTDTTKNNAPESGIIGKTTGDYTPYKPKASEINKIYSKSGTPGYYIQVGYFKTKKPSSEFLNRMKYSQLPYTILEKYKDNTPFYHALIGPYRSYNEANKIKGSAKEYVTSSAFIVNVVRP